MHRDMKPKIKYEVYCKCPCDQCGEMRKHWHVQGHCPLAERESVQSRAILGSRFRFLVQLVFIVQSPQYAIAAKRWHDRNKSGWWSLISLIPLVNFWMLIELGFLTGTDSANRFGPPA